ncbi:MAG TPA: amino acid adenylation domain-containing protein, partial [Thermoanaerobaculia bacterium]|nr:amino acid adenylation domain-containing protein [Thermoanaerobaculia bacterium]
MSQDSFVSLGQRVSARREGLGSGFAGIHQRIALRAERAPEAPALVCGDRCLTFEDLEVRTAALARRLRALGVGPESIVGVHLERSPDAVVALLAVLRAGGAYLPLDPSYPRERLSYMLADSGAAALVTREGLRGSLPQEVPLVLCVDGVGEGSGALLPELEEAGPESLAYVLYTSGTSGRPKGVGISHRSLAHHAEAVARAFGLGPRDRVLQFSSLSFDVAAEEIYPSLLMGAAVVFVPESRGARGALGPQGIVPEDLGAFAERERLTVLNLPSPYWHEWVDALERTGERLPSLLRLVVTGSEAVAPDKLAAWRRIVAAENERVVWMNAYGLTESTVTSTAFRLPLRRPDLELSPVPVGRPLGEVRAHVLDAGGQPAAPDTVGELWLGGPGIARGYLGRPDLTAERFIPDPFSSLPGARLLRTGDLARLGPDGNLRLLGRADAQLKVRGFRLEPEEIEAALRVHPAVRQAVVVARDERLTACLVMEGDAALTSSTLFELRDLLRQTLPEHMVPGAFLSLERLPVTANGKVDRRALTALAAGAAPAAASAEDFHYEAPRTPVEEALCGLWAALLGLKRVGVHDDFFHLGGHSLLATRLVSRVRSLFAVEIDLCDVFEAPAPAGLAARVEGAWRGVESPPLVPAPPAPYRPLSHAQRRLWFLYRFQGGSGAYNMPTLFRIRGGLRRDALAAALDEVVRRHEALRTVFAMVDGVPVQMVMPFAPAPLPAVDLSALPVAEGRAEAARLAAEDAQAPFDLGRGPLVRCTVLSLGADEHALLVNSHHIVSDGWSVGVLVRELIALYQAFAEGRPSPLPELAIQYGDFAVWQHEALDGPVMESQLGYWRQRLAGLPAALELPTDRQRPPVQTFRGAVEHVALPAALARDLERVGRDIGRGQGATLFMTLLAGFQSLLSRVTGQDDLLVGSPIANRTRAEVEDLIGFFVNTLVLRTDLSGGPTFSELLGRVRANALGAYAHQDVPFERLVEEISPERDLSRTPLFQVVFGLHNSPMPRMELAPGLTLSLEEPHTETSKFDL